MEGWERPAQPVLARPLWERAKGNPVQCHSMRLNILCSVSIQEQCGQLMLGLILKEPTCGDGLGEAGGLSGCGGEASVGDGEGESCEGCSQIHISQPGSRTAAGFATFAWKHQAWGPPAHQD